MSADATPRPKAKSFYRPELDALRFFAFLMVFLHHCVWPSRGILLDAVIGSGRFGASLFFLLSAYLIAELLMRENEKTGSIHIKAFFIRRALRIWPLYFLAIGLAYLANPFTRVHNVFLPLASLPFLLLSAGNVLAAHRGWSALGIIYPLWSLSVEEQFYLLLPSIVNLAGFKVLRYLCLLCLLASYGVLVWLTTLHAAPSPTIWVNSFVQFQFFALGVLIAMALHRRTWQIPFPARAGLFLLCVAALIAGETFFPYERLHLTPAATCVQYSIGFVYCAGIFLAFFNAQLRIPRFVSYLGQISFGLYVYHRFAFAAAERLFGNGKDSRASALLIDLLSLALTIAAAMLSYRFFEIPFLRLKERFATVKSGPAAQLTKA